MGDATIDFVSIEEADRLVDNPSKPDDLSEPASDRSQYGDNASTGFINFAGCFKSDESPQGDKDRSHSVETPSDISLPTPDVVRALTLYKNRWMTNWMSRSLI